MSQVLDMRVYCSVVSLKIIAQYNIYELVPGQDPAGIFSKRNKYPELCWSKRDRTVFNECLMLFNVDFQQSVVIALYLFVDFHCPSQMCLYSSNEFPWTERLDNIVVGAHSDALYPFFFI